MKRRDFVLLIGGAMVTMPAVARAQTSTKTPRIGILWHAGSPEEESPYFQSLIEGFAKLGYVEGRNISFEHRFPNEIPERFKSMAAELVSLNVDVLITSITPLPYLREATAKIPIVFWGVPDPVGMKFVQSLARPGENITGLSSFAEELAGKRLQLLKDLVPGLSRVAFLVNPNQQYMRMYVEGMRAAAGQLGLLLQMFEAQSVKEMDPAFDAMVKAGMQAATSAQGSIFYQARAAIPKLAIARRLPLCTWSRETFEYGSLVAYGPSVPDMVRRAAVYADKILKGAKPGELPIEQPTTFELLINLNVAKTLGLDVPFHLQQIADEVIE